MVGLPNFLEMTTLRPFGPSVTLTAWAMMLTPRRAGSSSIRLSRTRSCSGCRVIFFAWAMVRLPVPGVGGRGWWVRLVGAERSSPARGRVVDLGPMGLFHLEHIGVFRLENAAI